jgi:hypothetical protein
MVGIAAEALPLPDSIWILDKSHLTWEFPTMKITTVDTKRRLVLAGATPGESYSVREAAPGHYELAKVIPAPRPKPTAEEMDALLASAPLTPKMDWEELRSLTREP